MKKLSFLLSLTTNDNDYQIEQAASAQEAARRLGVQLQIVYADNDAITQSQQLLRVIQSSSSAPDAIVFEPAGSTGLPQVAKAAAAADIGWVMLNREADYIAELRRDTRIPVFAVSRDQENSASPTTPTANVAPLPSKRDRRRFKKTRLASSQSLPRSAGSRFRSPAHFRSTTGARLWAPARAAMPTANSCSCRTPARWDERAPSAQ